MIAVSETAAPAYIHAMNEKDLLRALNRAVADGRVSVALDCVRLQHTDSPIAVQADHNRWLYAVTAATVGAGLAFGWVRGAVALAVGVAVYFRFGRPWVHRRMRARFFATTLDDIADFKKIWHLRGVTLTLTATGLLCASPDGDWRRFALDYLIGPVAL